MKAWRPAVIHAHGHWYCLAGAYSLTGKKLAPRVVLTVHTNVEPPRNPVSRFVLRRLFNRPDIVTAVSSQSAVAFQRDFGLRECPQVVKPGIRRLLPNSASIEKVRADFGLHGKYPILCTVSMLVWRRKVMGVERLLESLVRVREKLPSVLLLVVGDGIFRPMLEEKARGLGIDDLVRFVGVTEDPSAFLHASDIVCHISQQDSFAQAMLEGMSVGKPVIVNDAFDLPEPLAQWGLLQASANPEGISGTILQLAEDHELRMRLGERAASAARTRFSWEESVRVFWELYGNDPLNSR